MSKAVAIIKPFRSEFLLSRKRCHIIIAVTWIIGFLLAAVHFKVDASWNTTRCSYRYPKDTGLGAFFLAYFMIAAALPRFLLIYGTIRIFIVVHRTQCQVAAQAQSVTRDENGTAHLCNITAQALRSSTNVLLLCVVTAVLTTPYFVFSIIRNGTDMDIPLEFVFYALRLLELNTVISSLLYLVLFSQVRKKTCQMFYEIYMYIRGI